MASGGKSEIVAVFRDDGSARAAADAASRALSGAKPRIGAEGVDVASLKAEMREEMQHTVAGAGNAGPFTKEMTKGLSVGALGGSLVGLVVGIGLGFIPWGSIGLGPRLIIGAIVGASAGATLGFVAGGGLAAKGPAQPLAAERGTTVSIDVRTPEEIERVTEAMRGHDPIRIDLTTAEGDALSTLTTEEEELERRQ